MNLRKLALVISQVGSQLRNGLLNMRNGTCVPKRCFAAAKIFASWPHFRKLKFQLKKCSQVEKIALFFSFYSSLWRPSNSFEIPSYFDHSKSLSYIKIKEIKAKIKIKTINKAFKSTKLKQKHGI